MDTDPTNDQHWHLTTTEGAAEFAREHGQTPKEKWLAVDFETAENFAAVRRFTPAA